MNGYPILLSRNDFNKHKRDGVDIALIKTRGSKRWNGSRFELSDEVKCDCLFTDPYFDITKHGSSRDNALNPLPSKRELLEFLKSIKVSQNSWFVFEASESIALAARAWWLFKLNGFEKISILDNTRTLYGNTEPVRVIQTSELEGMIDEKTSQIIDLRHPEEFGGVGFDGEGYPGHIPGSKNLFVKNLLDGEGCFLDIDNLKATVQNNIDVGLPVVSTCGGGVAATVLDIALRLLDLKTAIVYDGSMHAWTFCPDRKVSLGS